MRDVMQRSPQRTAHWVVCASLTVLLAALHFTLVPAARARGDQLGGLDERDTLAELQLRPSVFPATDVDVDVVALEVEAEAEAQAGTIRERWHLAMQEVIREVRATMNPVQNAVQSTSDSVEAAIIRSINVTARTVFRFEDVVDAAMAQAAASRPTSPTSSGTSAVAGSAVVRTATAVALPVPGVTSTVSSPTAPRAPPPSPSSGAGLAAGIADAVGSALDALLQDHGEHCQAAADTPGPPITVLWLHGSDQNKNKPPAITDTYR